jgi:hypothetical protein
LARELFHRRILGPPDDQISILDGILKASALFSAKTGLAVVSQFVYATPHEDIF